jgi:hypothetical protein
MPYGLNKQVITSNDWAPNWEIPQSLVSHYVTLQQLDETVLAESL